MEYILGFDLGVTSVGWAAVSKDITNEGKKEILGMGSRIIPISGDVVIEFQKGAAQTKNADRRILRGIRKLSKRYKQRRNKLIYILQKLNILPDQFELTENFEDPNKIQNVGIKPIRKDQKQPTAVDLLELRVKALTNKIEPKELGKLIYLYNQLRGYSGGGEDTEDEKEEEIDQEETNKNEKIVAKCIIQKIIRPENVKEDIAFVNSKKKKQKYTIEVKTEEGDFFSGETDIEKLEEGETKELQISIKFFKKGKGKNINYEKNTYISLVKKTNWRKKMENLETDLDELKLQKGREIYISEYFLEKLKVNRWTKIRNNVVLRYRYQAEFDAIWNEQSKHYSFLNNTDADLLNEIVQFVFPGKNPTQNPEFKQEKYRQEALEGGLYHLVRNQIIYFQRELKDQSDLISNCRFEPTKKVAPRSYPTFQEYKIWEQINKLSINTKTEIGKTKKGESKFEYEDKPIPSLLKSWLFDELQDKKEIKFGVILKKLQKEYGLRENVDFLNGMNAKATIRGNETRILLKKQLGGLWDSLTLDNPIKLVALWDILYNGKGNEYELTSDRTSQILTFLQGAQVELLDINKTAIQISKIKFARTYTSQSIEAIEKILPLVRAGKYFNNQFTDTLKLKVEKIYNENMTDAFAKSVQEYIHKNPIVLEQGGIMNSYATILVYDQHTAKTYDKDQLINTNEIERLKQGDLRNPLAEQIINETLMVLKDICNTYGKPTEIRIELARELKNNAAEREKIYRANSANQKANDSIKDKLKELKEDLSLSNVERYKLWSSQENKDAEYLKKYEDPTKSEVEKMKLWEEQGHISPYTGNTIPLSKLFDKGQYDIDHIIPKSRYFDDSLANKVICETSVNTDKGNRTAMEYFEIGSSICQISSKDVFIDRVNTLFYGKKRKNLLATKIPQDPINRQIKDTQYINTRLKEELNKIVGNDAVKTSTGGVTDYLRQHWGLTEKFKQLTVDRFENAKLQIAEFEYEKYVKEVNEKYKKYLSDYEKRKKEVEKDGVSAFAEEKKEIDTIVSKENFIDAYLADFITKDYNKEKNKHILKIKKWSKRLDHRHHAIDALIVACTEQKDIQRLNNLNKELQTLLVKAKNDEKSTILKDYEGDEEGIMDAFMQLNQDTRDKFFKDKKDSIRKIEMPWNGFAEDAKKEIEKIIVALKPRDSLVIQKNKSNELSLKVRGPLHQSTLYGELNGEACYRIPLTTLAKKSTLVNIEKIVNPFLKLVIKNHFVIKYNKVSKEAFSAEGIDELNKTLRDRKKKNKKGEIVNAPHPPIDSIKIYFKSQNEKINISKLGSKNINLNQTIERLLDEELKGEIKNHLLNFENNPIKAFSKAGLIIFNSSKTKQVKTIELAPINEEEENEESDNANNEKQTLQKLDRKKSFNDSLYVKTGGNYCFAVLEKEGKRIFDIISFFDATNIIKYEFDNSENKDLFNKEKVLKNYFLSKEQNKGATILFLLKQNDMVYLPNKEEEVPKDLNNEECKAFWNDKENRSKNIHSVVKFSGKTIYFIKHDIAKVIENKVELDSQNCYEFFNNISIKNNCIPIKIDRLGNISKATI